MMIDQDKIRHAESVGSAYVRTLDYEGVIFGEGRGWIRDDAWFAYWTPNLQEIQKAEDALRRMLEQIAATPPVEVWQRHTHYAAPLILAQLELYRRQYAGIVDQHRPAILMNFFRSDVEFDWMRIPVDVCDGGHDYFWSLYRPDLDTIRWLSVNGEA